VTFVVTAGGIESVRRCDDVDTWLPARDPTGTIRAAFDAVGATDDGCTDPGDLSKALAFAMTEAGVANTYIELTGAASNHAQLSSEDLELMADEVYALASPNS